jgi:2-hydroxychromene-2-carboxylate isomerase
MPRLTFWYEFASTYSYLAAMRADETAAAAGVEIVWQPFLLGPIFKVQGWNTSPFNLYAPKRRYMVRDIERTAAARGLHFKLPDPFPANGLKAARIATLGMEEGWVATFSKAVFDAEFAREADIADEGLLRDILDSLALDTGRIMERAGQPDIKDALRAATARALDIGIFGAPTFVSEDGDIFWGDDRLEAALAHARK